MGADVALHAVVFQLAVGAALTLRAAAFHLAVRAGVARRAQICQLPVGAGAAVRAEAFQLAERAGVAVGLAAFHLPLRAGVARRAVVFQLAVGARVALCAAAFQLAVGAGVALRAAAFHFAVRAGVAHRAPAFHLAVRARGARRAVLFQPGVGARGALNAAAFQLAVGAPFLSHRVSCTTVSRRFHVRPRPSIASSYPLCTDVLVAQKRPSEQTRARARTKCGSFGARHVPLLDIRDGVPDCRRSADDNIIRPHHDTRALRVRVRPVTATPHGSRTHRTRWFPRSRQDARSEGSPTFSTAALKVRARRHLSDLEE